MKKIFTLLLIIGTALPTLAQRTSGGSTQSWRRFDVTYDTIYRTVTESVSMPSTSKSYIRGGLLRGRGKWAEPSRPYWPEWGRYDNGDTAGGDMSGGFELAFGGWNNLTNTNKQLHPAIDLSSIWELGWQNYTYELSEDVPFYEVEYGSTHSFYYGLGLGATIKPLLFSGGSLTDPSKSALLVDIGITANLHLHYSSESTYRAGGIEATFGHDDDLLGSRMNTTLYLGVRYNFISVYMTYATDLVDLYNPEYTHSSTSNSSQSFTDYFEEDVDFNTLSFGVGLNF